MDRNRSASNTVGSASTRSIDTFWTPGGRSFFNVSSASTTTSSDVSPSGRSVEVEPPRPARLQRDRLAPRDVAEVARHDRDLARGQAAERVEPLGVRRRPAPGAVAGALRHADRRLEQRLPRLAVADEPAQRRRLSRGAGGGPEGEEGEEGGAGQHRGWGGVRRGSPSTAPPRRRCAGGPTGRGGRPGSRIPRRPSYGDGPTRSSTASPGHRFDSRPTSRPAPPRSGT